MIIQVNDKYRIVTYNMGWTIETLLTYGEKSSMYGQTYWKNEGHDWYGEGFEQVLRGLYNKLLIENGVELSSLDLLVDVQMAIYDKIKEIGKKCYKSSEVHMCGRELNNMKGGE